MGGGIDGGAIIWFWGYQKTTVTCEQAGVWCRRGVAPDGVGSITLLCREASRYLVAFRGGLSETSREMIFFFVLRSHANPSDIQIVLP